MKITKAELVRREHEKTGLTASALKRHMASLGVGVPYNYCFPSHINKIKSYGNGPIKVSTAFKKPAGSESRQSSIASIICQVHQETGLTGTALKKETIKRHGKKFNLKPQRFSPSNFQLKVTKLPTEDGTDDDLSEPSTRVDSDYEPIKPSKIKRNYTKASKAKQTTNSAMSFCPCCGANLKVLAAAFQVAGELSR